MEANEKCMLYLLGAGIPTPTPERFGTASVLQIGHEFLLFDCGPATTYKLVRAGLWPTQIDHLFLTHHHFDHNVDLPCFLLCRWDQSVGKEKILKIYGPDATTEIVDKLVGPNGAFANDWKARVSHPGSKSVHVNRGGTLPRPEPKFDVRDLKSGDTVEGSGWKVSAVQVHHAEPWLISLAYRIDTTQGSIVFAGDTGPCKPIRELARGANVFMANCWDHQDIMDANGEAPGLTGTMDATRFAAESGADCLVLGHMGPRLSSTESQAKAMADIRTIYSGKVVFGEEGLVIDLFRDSITPANLPG